MGGRVLAMLYQLVFKNKVKLKCMMKNSNMKQADVLLNEKSKHIDNYPELDEWDEDDEPEDDVDYTGLDPAFNSWEDVNSQFFTRY
jgi:hypothetical protein